MTREEKWLMVTQISYRSIIPSIPQISKIVSLSLKKRATCGQHCCRNQEFVTPKPDILHLMFTVMLGHLSISVFNQRECQ